MSLGSARRTWWDAAACVGEGGAWFQEGSDAVARARRFAPVARCPVRQACLDYASENGEAWGIWGGLTPTERSAAGVIVRSGSPEYRRFRASL